MICTIDECCRFNLGVQGERFNIINTSQCVYVAGALGVFQSTTFFSWFILPVILLVCLVKVVSILTVLQAIPLYGRPNKLINKLIASHHGLIWSSSV